MENTRKSKAIHMCPETPDTRVCKTCGTEKPLTKENFYWRADASVFRRECKACWQQAVLKQKLGVDFEWYHKRLRAQGGTCEICKCKLESSRYTKFAVDHCHKSGEVRGLLCTHCNTGLGLFKDSPERLAGAIRYLQNRTPSEDIV